MLVRDLGLEQERRTFQCFDDWDLGCLELGDRGLGCSRQRFTSHTPVSPVSAFWWLFLQTYPEPHLPALPPLGHTTPSSHLDCGLINGLPAVPSARGIPMKPSQPWFLSAQHFPTASASAGRVGPGPHSQPSSPRRLHGSRLLVLPLLSYTRRRVTRGQGSVLSPDLSPGPRIGPGT